MQPLPTEGTISALNIPHSSIVFDLHQVTEIQSQAPQGATALRPKVKHANLVSFTCLKSFAFDQRFERKDAHDLIYCIEHAPEGSAAVIAFCKSWLASTACDQTSLAILHLRFLGRKDRGGIIKDGPVSVAKFRTWRESDEPEQRKEGALRRSQRRDRTTLGANRIGGGVANGLDDDRLRKSVGAETAARLRPKTKGTIGRVPEE